MHSPDSARMTALYVEMAPPPFIAVVKILSARATVTIPCNVCEVLGHGLKSFEHETSACSLFDVDRDKADKNFDKYSRSVENGLSTTTR